jgi:hypothetical protein
MKKKEKKELKEKLIVAVKKVLNTNNAILTAKIEKSAEKYISEIVKKSKKKIIAKKKPAVAK